MSAKTSRSRLTRRSIIAAGPGLTAAALAGKFCRAQDDGILPDAIMGMDMFAPVPAPAMRFADTTGRQLSLRDYAGHPLVVNLWATWCGPCVDELPSFAALAPKFRALGGLVLPVSIDLSGAAVVAPFYASHGIRNLPILLDQDGNDMQVLGTDGVPVTIVLNAAGEMVGRVDGSADWDTKGVLDYLRTLGGTPRRPGPSGFQPV